MSAWYLFSALGFYPVNPATGIYILGIPLLDRASIKLPSGRTFTVEAVKTSANDIYVNRIELNGRPWLASYIRHEDILKGGTLKIFMAEGPNYEFGKASSARPPLR
jgi:putative alpha-1,2-mannosidase